MVTVNECGQLSGVNRTSVTDHVSLCGLQGTGDGRGAPLRHVLAQTLLYVPVELLEQKKKISHNNETFKEHNNCCRVSLHVHGPHIIAELEVLDH